MLSWLVAAGVLVAAAGLIWWLTRQKPRNNGGLSSLYDDEESFREEIEREWQKLQQEQREKDARIAEALIRDVLNGEDNEVAQLLLDLSNMKGRSSYEVASDKELVQRIANSVEPNTLKVLSFASRTSAQLENIELKTQRELEESLYPADTFEYMPMTDLDQVVSAVPEDMAVDELFWSLIGDESLIVIQHYEEVLKKKRLYILLDVSGSMRQVMADYGTRMQWASGVALKLMLRAQAGEAEYLIRYFGDDVYKLRKVESAEEAVSMIQELLELTDYDEGTHIHGALVAAVKDIRAAGKDVETSDILLITDGESRLDENWLRETFGDEIRLHVAMIGLQNRLLAEVSSSYQVYG